ncbi:MAG: helix-hairpin-helix domain-containing protein [Bacteroidia bacterium]
MNNLIIAEQLHQLAKLMELHQENPFKVKAIANASSIIEKLNQDIDEKNYTQLADIKGIGKNILEKIHEVLLYGKIKELEQYESVTPPLVIEMLHIRGLGAAKVYKLWKEAGIESIEQLIKAAENNQLTNIKGFTKKTQESILENAYFYLKNRNKLQLGLAMGIAHNVINFLRTHHISVEITGELRRHCEIITRIDLITTQRIDKRLKDHSQTLSPIPVIIHESNEKDFAKDLLLTTGSDAFLSTLPLHILSDDRHYASEKDLFRRMNIPYVIPPQRESVSEYAILHRVSYTNKSLEYKDIKGILHCHTDYSDGLHSLRQMADYCREQGFEYLGICDHSQTAKYAGGLEPERVLSQMKEIDEYNQQYTNFQILKGIESDILKNGDLDYDEDILKKFDFVVASIHQHFEMDEKEATARLIKAIENPYTNIIGHLTGRLLLIRKGYPVHHRKIIDACAANKVAIELNANTYRLDIDWRYLSYCMEKGVKIAINPDAHSTTAIHDTKYGVMVAQKAGLEKESVINTYSVHAIRKFFQK